ncbi:MAG: hypothetical protein ACLVBP_16705 [Ruminococcus sp.]
MSALDKFSSMAQAAGLAALQETEYVEKGRQVTFEELALPERAN